MFGQGSVWEGGEGKGGREGNRHRRGKGEKNKKKKEWMRRVTNPEFPELRRAEKMCRGKSFCASDERCYMVLKFTHETKKKMKRGEKGDR